MRGAVFVAAALSLVFAACSGPNYVPVAAARPVLVDTQDPAALRSAILRALVDRDFKTDGEEPGRILASSAKGDQVRIAVEYAGNQYMVRYIDSGLRQTAATDGSTLVEEKYTKIVERLEKAIRKELVRGQEQGLYPPAVGVVPVMMPVAAPPPGYAPAPPPGYAPAAPPGYAPAPPPGYAPAPPPPVVQAQP